MIRCDGCAHPIDPDCCQCGDAIKPTGQHADNHIAVPMGCRCRDVYDERASSEALEAIKQFRLWRGETLRAIAGYEEAVRRLKESLAMEQDNSHERLVTIVGMQAAIDEWEKATSDYESDDPDSIARADKAVQALQALVTRED